MPPTLSKTNRRHAYRAFSRSSEERRPAEQGDVGGDHERRRKPQPERRPSDKLKRVRHHANSRDGCPRSLYLTLVGPELRAPALLHPPDLPVEERDGPRREEERDHEIADLAEVERMEPNRHLEKLDQPDPERDRDREARDGDVVVDLPH